MCLFCCKGDVITKEVTRIMFNKYKLAELGHDFMGFSFKRPEEISFHHLIVAKRHCAEMGLGNGEYVWNGSLLVRNTGHDYAHIIERIDPDVFYALTSEMVDMNVKGFLDPENLRYIDDILCSFEREHCGERTKKGKMLIKEEYTRRVKY